MANIFKEVENGFKVLKSYKPKGNTDADRNNEMKLNGLRLDTLEMLQGYIDKGDWFESSSRRTIFLENYKLPVKVYADNIGQSEDSVRHVINRASSKLKRILGSTIVDDIVKGTIKDVNNAKLMLTELNSDSNFLSNFIPQAIGNKGISEPNNSYTIKDLTNELLFLQLYSKNFLEEYIKTLNEDKLKYILSLLNDNKSKYIRTQMQVYSHIADANKSSLMLDILNSIKVDDIPATATLVGSVLQSHYRRNKG